MVQVVSTAMVAVTTGLVIAAGGAMVAFAAPGEAGPGIGSSDKLVVTIADIVRWKYDEAISETAEEDDADDMAETTTTTTATTTTNAISLHGGAVRFVDPELSGATALITLPD